MPKLLVVDDEPVICQSFHWVFGPTGVEVVTAGTAADGWRRVQEDRPDVIVLDLQLPDGSGLDLFERVRAAEVDAQREKLRAQIEEATEELGVAQKALPALQRAVDAATANLDQANARFGKGLGTAVELADAEALLTDSQIQLAVGQFQRARARARLARVIAEVVP